MNNPEKNPLFEAYLQEKIDAINANDFHPSNFKELYDLKQAIITASITNRKENLEHYIKFAERVKNEPYFRLDHINELGLPYDILIFVSEKNIGKSRQMLWHMNDAYERGKQFVIMRSLDAHLQVGLDAQLAEKHSNFYYYSMKGTIYSKDTKELAGYAMSLNTCTKFKGGSFDDVEWIWFDEATDEHKDITVNSFRRLFISVVNSIERRKDEFKVIIMGNTDFSVSHPLFEFFEIDPSENLIYRTHKAPGAERSTRVLYINSKGLYGKGAKGSKFIGAGGDPKAALDAFMNSVKNNTDRLVAIDLTYLADPFFALLFKDYEGKEWVLTVAKHDFKEAIDGITNIEEKINTWYYIKIDEFKPEYLYGYRIYTDDVTMHTLYRGFTTYKKRLDSEWVLIKRMIRFGRVIFIKKDTKIMLYKLLEKKTMNAKMLLG